MTTRKAKFCWPCRVVAKVVVSAKLFTNFLYKCCPYCIVNLQFSPCLRVKNAVLASWWVSGWKHFVYHDATAIVARFGTVNQVPGFPLRIFFRDRTSRLFFVSFYLGISVAFSCTCISVFGQFYTFIWNKFFKYSTKPIYVLFSNNLVFNLTLPTVGVTAQTLSIF